MNENKSDYNPLFNVFVVCGSRQEYNNFVKQYPSPNSTVLRYLPDGEGKKFLEGTTNPAVIYYGSYETRKDIAEIENIVKSRMTEIT